MTDGSSLAINIDADDPREQVTINSLSVAVIIGFVSMAVNRPNAFIA